MTTSQNRSGRGPLMVKHLKLKIQALRLKVRVITTRRRKLLKSLKVKSFKVKLLQQTAPILGRDVPLVLLWELPNSLVQWLVDILARN